MEQKIENDKVEPMLSERDGGTKAPPLGLKPRYVWLSERVNEVVQASARYAMDGRDVPKEWTDEWEWLLREIKLSSLAHKEQAK